MRMASKRFRTALEVSQEVELTVTGRKTGKERTARVWFVHDGDRLYLLPVNGTDSSWFKNVLDNRTVRLAAEGTQITARAKPVTDPAVVGQVVAMFRAKYGSENVRPVLPEAERRGRDPARLNGQAVARQASIGVSTKTGIVRSVFFWYSA